MRIRNLDSNGDWTFGQGTNDYLIDNPAIGLNIKTRILSWLGDCFFDTGAGIDWWNRLGSKGQKDLLDMDIRRIILQSYGVTGILTFDSVLTDRNYTANYSVETIFSASYAATVSKDL